ARGGQTARLFPARDDEHSARAAYPGQSQNLCRGGCRTTARLFSPWRLAPEGSVALTRPDGCTLDSSQEPLHRPTTYSSVTSKLLNHGLSPGASPRDRLHRRSPCLQATVV